jgi:hypothetical protein
MLNIINEQKHWDDHRRIRAVSCKVKYIKEEGKPILLGNELLATVSHAFYRTTFQYDERGRLNIEQGTRKEVVDLTIRLPKTSNLTRIDVDKFFEAFQAALDDFETSLFPK